jgi:hypothetical protein
VQAGEVSRPVGVSVGVLFVILVGYGCIVGPMWRRCGEWAVKFWMGAEGGQSGVLGTNGINAVQWGFVLLTLLLLGFVTGATFAGTSRLFAAYLAGMVVSWWDDIGVQDQTVNDGREHELSSDSITASPNVSRADTP